MGRTSDARERIVTSASSLMHERGYTAVGVSEVCARAGVNKGSFYHYFQSKQELAGAVIDDFWGQYSSLLETLVHGSDPPLSRLRSFFHSSYERQQEIKASCGRMLGCPFGNLALEMSTQDETIRQALRQRFDLYTDHFEQLLQEAVAAGDLPPQDERRSARSILALLQGALLMAKMNDDPDALRGLPDQAMLLIQAP